MDAHTPETRTGGKKKKQGSRIDPAIAARAAELMVQFDTALGTFLELLLEAMCAGLLSKPLMAEMRATGAFKWKNLAATAGVVAEAAAGGGAGGAAATDDTPAAVVKTPRTRESRFNNYTLFVTLVNALTSVNNMSAAAACWKNMDPQLKQDLVGRLEGIKAGVNELAKAAGKGEKVHVAEQLAAYEAAHKLKTFPWKDVIAPYAAMPNNRKKKAPDADEAAAAAPQPPAKKSKKAKQ